MSHPVHSSPPAKNRNCLLYGCLTLIVLMVAVSIGGFFLVRYGMQQLTAFVEEYTDTVPMTIEQVHIEPGEFEELEKRMTAFHESLTRGEHVEPLVLTGHDLNVLIARHPEMEAWRNHAHLQVVGDQIVGQISLPLDHLAALPGMQTLRGRYLNGAAALGGFLRHGRLVVNLESIEVKGRPIPEEIMKPLRQHNLIQDLDANPDFARTIGLLQSIEVADGRITITAAEPE